MAAISTRKAIAKLLMTEWDPIGIGDVSGASNEYDAYAEYVARLLLDHKSVSEISSYLVDVEFKQMGLRPDSGRAMRVAEKAFALTR